MVDGVLGPDMVAAAAIDHQQHSLQQPDDPVAELGAELDQLTLVQSAARKRRSMLAS
jgi:hypothetical protein